MAEYRLALITLFKEAFEGIPAGASGTWFVQGKEGIFDAVESMSSEVASRKPAPECSSIAAHTDHVRYYMSLANAEVRGEPIESDWEGSWARQVVSESEWAEIMKGLRKEYAGVLTFLESNPDWKDQDWLTGAFAQLAHAAYHLGAIRQIMKVI